MCHTGYLICLCVWALGLCYYYIYKHVLEHAQILNDRWIYEMANLCAWWLQVFAMECIQKIMIACEATGDSAHFDLVKAKEKPHTELNGKNVFSQCFKFFVYAQKWMKKKYISVYRRKSRLKKSMKLRPWYLWKQWLSKNLFHCYGWGF